MEGERLAVDPRAQKLPPFFVVGSVVLGHLLKQTDALLEPSVAPGSRALVGGEMPGLASWDAEGICIGP
jgi:hypothetical protein